MQTFKDNEEKPGTWTKMRRYQPWERCIKCGKFKKRARDMCLNCYEYYIVGGRTKWVEATNG